MSLFNCKELRPIAKSYAKTKETDGKGMNKYELESNMPKWMAKAAPNPFWWLMSHISSSLASFFGLRFGPSQQDTDRQTVFGCWSQLIPSPCQLMKMFKNDDMCTSLLEWKKKRFKKLLENLRKIYTVMVFSFRATTEVGAIFVRLGASRAGRAGRVRAWQNLPTQIIINDDFQEVCLLTHLTISDPFHDMIDHQLMQNVNVLQNDWPDDRERRLERDRLLFLFLRWRCLLQWVRRSQFTLVNLLKLIRGLDQE